MDELIEERLARAGRTAADDAGVRAEVAALVVAHARRGHRRWLAAPGAVVGIGLLLAGATAATASGSWTTQPGASALTVSETAAGSACIVDHPVVVVTAVDGSTLNAVELRSTTPVTWQPVGTTERAEAAERPVAVVQSGSGDTLVVASIRGISGDVTFPLDEIDSACPDSGQE